MTMLTLGVAESRREQGIAGELPVAAHPDRHGRGAEPARRRRRHGGRAPARDRRRRGVRRSSTRPARECTGNTFIDDEVLAEAGVTDLSRYRFGEGTEDDLQLDIFL